MTGGGDGEGEVDEATWVARTEKCHAVNEGAVEGDAIVNVLIGVLEEANGDRASCPGVGRMFDGALMVETEAVRRNVGAEDGTEVATAVGVVTDNESVGNAGVEEGAGSDAIATEEGEAIATATVDNFGDRRVREPKAERRISVVKEERDTANVKDVGVTRCLGERDGAIRRDSSVDAELEELHSAAGEAEVTFEVKGDKAGMAGLGEDGVQMGQGGAGGLLKLMIGGVMGGGVATRGGFSIKRVGRNGGGGDESKGRRKGEYRGKLGGSGAAIAIVTGGTDSLEVKGRVVGVVEIELGGKRVRRSTDG